MKKEIEHSNTPYGYNDTMAMIGHQSIEDILDSDLHSILDAHLAAGKGTDISALMMDAFVYGVIAGKRNERTRRQTKRGGGKGQ